MGIVQTAAPAVEPVTLAEAKLHLNEIDNVQDTLIGMLITAAREYAEAYCARSFITQQWRLTLDEFPCGCIELERGPVQSVDSIVFRDMAGVLQTVAGPTFPAYAIDLESPLARVAPGFGYTWPNSLPQIGAVQVNYTAGFGPTAADVPAVVRNWIMVRVNTMFENREEVAVLQRGSVTPLAHIDRLLDPVAIQRA
jgi:uncharacterized phiE125 gp8 family phage protein